MTFNFRRYRIGLSELDGLHNAIKPFLKKIKGYEVWVDVNRRPLEDKRDEGDYISVYDIVAKTSISTHSIRKSDLVNLSEILKLSSRICQAEPYMFIEEDRVHIKCPNINQKMAKQLIEYKKVLDI